MKKLLMLAVVLAGQIFAMEVKVDAGVVGEDAASEVVRQDFRGTDGALYYLRAATELDIDNPVVGVSEENRPDRKERVRNGYFGVFIVEDSDNKFVRSLFTGRMPIGVQPWPCDAASLDHARLSIIINFYDWLIRLQGIEPVHINVARNTAPGTRVELINNNVHAATVVIPTAAPFNTVVVQDAVAMLYRKMIMREIKYSVAPDADITPAGVPSFIISATKQQPAMADGSKSKVFPFPYYPEDLLKKDDGMRYVTVTSMIDAVIPELPEAIVMSCKQYVDGLAARLQQHITGIAAMLDGLRKY